MQHKHRVVVFDLMRFGTHAFAHSMPVSAVAVPTVSISVAGAMQLPAFAFQCSWHEIRPSLSLELVLFGIRGLVRSRVRIWAGTGKTQNTAG
jgi:hypothetical protein